MDEPVRILDEAGLLVAWEAGVAPVPLIGGVPSGSDEADSLVTRRRERAWILALKSLGIASVRRVVRLIRASCLTQG
jgi:hypothetical protein